MKGDSREKKGATKAPFIPNAYIFLFARIRGELSLFRFAAFRFTVFYEVAVPCLFRTETRGVACAT